jgi:hypothetical protein
MPAQARRENPAPGPAAAEVLAAGFGEGLERALNDALAADVDPAAGGHLAVHEQALAVELVEVLPRGPARNEVRVGDQHARRVRVRLEDADRLARLDQQRFVVLQVPERREDVVEAVPVARRAPDAAVDHEVLRILGDLRIEVVLDHPVRGLGQPALARALRAARRANLARRVVARIVREIGQVRHGDSLHR